ncbi:uncharacterized protein [Drosophila suzukii]|uniref:RNA-directed DNA polymerase n=1 Tax=Drosophila suzukii TaxID=28584 RepID=A0ABM4TZF5_DROSZ
MDARTILAMTVSLLRAKLSELGLKTTGRKGALQVRLFDHYGLVVADDEDDDTDEEGASVSGSSNYQEAVQTSSSRFTLRDIQDSVSSFSGSEQDDVNHWLSEFDDVAITVGWHNLQKFIYAKQLLIGAAKLYIKSTSGVRGWIELKNGLKEEFGKKLCSAEIHKILRQRQKQPKETCIEYLYSLMEISKPINLDEESLVSYFVDGIPDSKINKAGLYRAKSVRELKEEVFIYEKMKGMGNSKDNFNRESTGKQTQSNFLRKCFKCNSEVHIAKDYKKGHISKNCDEKKATISIKKELANVLEEKAAKGLIYKKMKAEGVTFIAKIDSGCDLCLMREDIFKSFDGLKLKPKVKHLRGIGKGELVTVGCFDVDLEADGVCFSVTFHVAKQNELEYAAIVGNDVLQSVDVIFSSNGVEFRAIERDFASTFNGMCVTEIVEESSVLDKINLSHLDDCQKLKVQQLVTEYKPIKSIESPVSMRIVLEDDIPVYQRPRRTSYENKFFIEKQRQEWLAEGIIVPSSSGQALQRYLGLTSYMRRFIKDYALTAKPLSDLLRMKSNKKDDRNLTLTEQGLLSFNLLKQLLVSALKLFDPIATTEMHTDGSKYGFGGDLMQRDSEDQQFPPVEFMSRKTNGCEEKYSSYELEVLAIVNALKKLRVYLLGKPFTVVTGCNTFAMTIKKDDLPPRVARWAMALREFEFQVEHRAGTKMRHVDALSRLSGFLITDSTKSRLVEAQDNDSWITNNILCKDAVLELLVVPNSMEEEIISVAHKEGHFGIKKTRDILEKSYYIPRIQQKVERVVKGCVECLIIDSKRGKKEGLLSPIDKAQEPLGTYHIDPSPTRRNAITTFWLSWMDFPSLFGSIQQSRLDPKKS